MINSQMGEWVSSFNKANNLSGSRTLPRPNNPRYLGICNTSIHSHTVAGPRLIPNSLKSLGICFSDPYDSPAGCFGVKDHPVPTTVVGGEGTFVVDKVAEATLSSLIVGEVFQMNRRLWCQLAQSFAAEDKMQTGGRPLTKVELRPNESQTQLLRRFRRKVTRSGKMSVVRRKRWFVSKSELRRIARKKAIRRHHRHKRNKKR